MFILWLSHLSVSFGSLYNNQIGDSGAQSLAEALKSNTSLQTLEWVLFLFSSSPTLPLSVSSLVWVPIILVSPVHSRWLKHWSQTTRCKHYCEYISFLFCISHLSLSLVLVCSTIRLVIVVHSRWLKHWNQTLHCKHYSGCSSLLSTITKPLCIFI